MGPSLAAVLEAATTPATSSMTSPAHLNNTEPKSFSA